MLKHLLLCIVVFVSFSGQLYSQVGIGTNSPNASSVLEISSNNKGLLIPRMTQAERLAIVSPGNGLLVYQTDNTNGFWYCNNVSVWINLQGSAGWDVSGNTGTNPATNFLGTTDANGVDFITNNNTAVTVLPTGEVGIGETNPTVQLHLKGSYPLFRFNNGSEGLDKILSTDANGIVSWVDNSILSTPDADWIFASGTTLSDPVYHEGPVTIGNATASTHDLDVDNGMLTGTTFGIGDVEYITDGNFATQFSHNFVPNVDNTYSLGSASFRWNTIYSVNGTIQTSDANLKENITSLTYGVNTLMELKPITFNWKKDNHHGIEVPLDQKELKIGFIAQELQKVIPEVVYSHSWKKKSEKDPKAFVRSKNKLLGVNYEELIPVLVKAKQEQDARIKRITLENEQLIKELESLIAKN